MVIVKVKERNRYINLDQMVSFTVDEEKGIAELYMVDKNIYRVDPESFDRFLDFTANEVTVI